MKKIFKKNKKIIYIIFFIFFLFLIYILFFNKKENITLNNIEKNSFKVEDISSFMGNKKIISMIGKVENKDNSIIYSEVSGIVKNINYLIGESVNKNELLVEINSEDANYRLIQAESLLNSQKARLNELYSGNLEEIIKIRESAVDASKINLERTIKQAEDAVINSRKSLLNNDLRAYLIDSEKHISSSIIAPTISGVYNFDIEGNYKISLYRSRTQTGYSFRYIDPEGKEGVGPAIVGVPQKLGESGLFIQFSDGFEDNYTLEWEVPIPNNRSATYLTFKNLYQNSLNDKEPLIRQAEELLKQREEEYKMALTGTREEQIMAQEEQVKQAEAGYNLSLSNLNKYFIRAPFNGKISSINVKENNLINPGQEILVVVGDNIFEIKGGISKEKAKFVSTGDIVTINKKDKGEIIAISDSINSKTGQVDVLIRVTEDENNLVSGEYVNVEIETRELNDTIYIPLSSLIANSSGTFILSLENDSTKRIPVIIGKIEDNYVSIVSGLEGVSNIITNPF